MQVSPYIMTRGGTPISPSPASPPPFPLLAASSELRSYAFCSQSQTRSQSQRLLSGLAMMGNHFLFDFAILIGTVSLHPVAPQSPDIEQAGFVTPRVRSVAMSPSPMNSRSNEVLGTLSTAAALKSESMLSSRALTTARRRERRRRAAARRAA